MATTAERDAACDALLNNMDPEYRALADKHKLRDFIKEYIFVQHLAPWTFETDTVDHITSLSMTMPMPRLEVLGRRADLEAHYTSAQIEAMTMDDKRKAFQRIKELNVVQDIVRIMAPGREGPI
jgi:hypothetical protein